MLKKIRQIPKLGDKRIVKKFAWLPKKVKIKELNAECVLWFERYSAVQTYGIKHDRFCYRNSCKEKCTSVTCGLGWHTDNLIVKNDGRFLQLKS